MKALRGKRKDSEQKSHTAPPLFLLATSILGHSHNYKFRDTQTENSSCRRSQWGFSIWTSLWWRKSGNIYYRYAKIHYSVPKQVQMLTGITNRTIETHGVPFRDVMDGLVALIRREAMEPAIIIAHGGYVHDFPIILASCMKHHYSDFAVLAELVYIDSKTSKMLAIGDPNWMLYVKNSRSREGDTLP